MKTIQYSVLAACCIASGHSIAQTDEERIKSLEEKVEILSQVIEQQGDQTDNESSRFHFGGYGEMKYSNLDADGTDDITLDFHRFVIFYGYEFNDTTRFVSEFEIEHIIASDGSRGAVEIEQAYLEFDLQANLFLKTGVMLMPVGIINETHEPPTFYGVDRPIIETTIIPSTWWSGGVQVTHQLASGFSYDLMITEGLETEDPSTSLAADPFDIKGGKQKTSFADAHDLAITGRVKYTGVAGLELAAYAQYQPDLDQSAEISYADSATLVGGHGIYQFSDFTATALYARWTLDGDDAAAAGKDVQDGGYLELSYRPSRQWGVFVRQSEWSQQTDEDNSQTNVGMNYWPIDDIVFKVDVQSQNQDAGNADGFKLGMGYQF